MDVQSEEFRKAQAHIWRHASCLIPTACLICAVELGIADAIHSHGKPMPLSDLTNSLPSNPSRAPHIHRVMRVLVKDGFFTEEQSNVYALTPSSRLLLKNEPLNLRGLVLPLLGTEYVKALGALGKWFQTEDQTPFEIAHDGKTFWDYSVEQTKHAQSFNENMASDSKFVAKLLTTEYKFLFKGLDSIVDVGGGTGTNAKAIAKAFPGLRCTVFDQPHVVANLESTENLEFVGGDMFDRIPSADAIILKIVLHDWNDEDCVKILKNCKKSIPEKEKGGKLILIENVMFSKKDDNESVKIQMAWDIDMLTLFGAKERTEDEWATLIRQAGFSGYKVFPNMDFVRSIIEVYP